MPKAHQGNLQFLSSYLGVEISHLPNNEGFSLAQPYLTERIIQALKFDPSTTKSPRGNTPVAYPLLSKDKDGLARKAD